MSHHRCSWRRPNPIQNSGRTSVVSWNCSVSNSMRKAKNCELPLSVQLIQKANPQRIRRSIHHGKLVGRGLLPSADPTRKEASNGPKITGIQMDQNHPPLLPIRNSPTANNGISKDSNRLDHRPTISSYKTHETMNTFLTQCLRYFRGIHFCYVASSMLAPAIAGDL